MLRGRNARTRVDHSDVEVPVYRFRRNTHLAHISEFNGIAHEIEKHLREALLVTETHR